VGSLAAQFWVGPPPDIPDPWLKCLGVHHHGFGSRDVGSTTGRSRHVGGLGTLGETSGPDGPVEATTWVSLYVFTTHDGKGR
jgi:hypothetical protein